MEALWQLRPAQLLQPEGYHSNHLRLEFFTKEGKGGPPRSREGKWKGDFWRVWGLTELAEWIQIVEHWRI